MKNLQKEEEIFKNESFNNSKSKKFRAFQFIYTFLENYFSKKEEVTELVLKEDKILSKEKKEISEKIDKYLQNGLLELIIVAYKNGYELNVVQKQKFNNKIFKLIMENNLLALENCPSDLVDDTLLAKWLLTNHAGKAEIFITERYNEKWSEEKFIDALFTTANGLVKEINNVIDSYKKDKGLEITKNFKEIKTLADNYNIILNTIVKVCFHKIEPNLSLDIYVDFLENVNKNITFIEMIKKNANHPVFSEIRTDTTDIMNLIQQITFQISTCFEKDKMSFIEQVKNNNLDNLLTKKVLENNSKTSSDSIIKALPEQTQSLIKDINTKIQSCLKEEEVLSHENKLTIESLYEKRIPEIISKYTSIDKEYLLKLKSIDGYTPEQLMNQSLQNIEEKVDELIININQSRIDSLSATQRYTQKIKIN